jgi:ferredoxin--NADP+ reductase
VLRSIDHRTVPIEGVPFDPATSTLNNIAGQVVHPSTGEVAPGEYVAGWAKRGPTGKIGNNKPDSASTVAGSRSSPTRTGGPSTPTSGPPAPPRAAPGSS